MSATLLGSNFGEVYTKLVLLIGLWGYKNIKKLKQRKVAHPAGLEPATPRFEAWYSIQLNYRCAEGVTSHAKEMNGAPASARTQACCGLCRRFR